VPSENVPSENVPSEFPLTDFETVLRTTRSVRKRLDLERPVELSVVHECLDIALQAPTGGFSQDWRFLVVTDPDLRREIAGYYERAYEAEVAAALQDRSLYAKKVKGRLAEPTDPVAKQRVQRILDGAEHLARNLHRVPVHVIACATRPNPERGGPGTSSGLYGSVFPAVWSLQLALRSRGLGSIITTLHLHYEAEVAELLDIPDSATQVCLLPVAHTIGLDFRPAARRGVADVSYLDRWGGGWPLSD
jgi:nitroreductase